MAAILASFHTFLISSFPFEIAAFLLFSKESFFIFSLTFQEAQTFSFNIVLP